MAPIPPTTRASWAPPLLEMTKVGPPPEPCCNSIHSKDVSEAADVYGPARAMSSISPACFDKTFRSSHSAKLIRSHSAAFFASHGASKGTDLHICSTSSRPTPRLAIAHGLIVQGIVP